MFIDPLGCIKFFRSGGAKCTVRRIRLPVHCAPLERQTAVAGEVYKHLAPLEPEQEPDKETTLRLLSVN